MGNILDNENLGVFFDANEFAETLTFSGVDATGIWSEDYVDELDIQGKVPLFLVKTSDANSIAIDTSTTRNSTTYKVKVKQHDGTGLSTLVLEKQ